MVASYNDPAPAGLNTDGADESGLSLDTYIGIPRYLQSMVFTDPAIMRSGDYSTACELA